MLGSYSFRLFKVGILKYKTAAKGGFFMPRINDVVSRNRLSVSELCGFLLKRGVLQLTKYTSTIFVYPNTHSYLP